MSTGDTVRQYIVSNSFSLTCGGERSSPELPLYQDMMASSRLALVRVHLTLSHDQLMAVWREQDHMVRGRRRSKRKLNLTPSFTYLVLTLSLQNDTDFSTEKFFHLHDIDSSGQIDKQVNTHLANRHLANRQAGQHTSS